MKLRYLPGAISLCLLACAIETATATERLLGDSLKDAYFTYALVMSCRDEILIKPETLAAFKNEIAKLEKDSNTTTDQRTKLQREVLTKLKATTNDYMYDPKSTCSLMQIVIKQYERDATTEDIFPDAQQDSDDPGSKPEKVPETDDTKNEIDVDKPATSQTAKRLPINDGDYVRSAAECSQLNQGELDFIDLSVENDGTSYTMPEIACTVLDTEPLKNGTYAVSGECKEVEQTWQQQFLLRVKPDGSVALDGKPLLFCKREAKSNEGEVYVPTLIDQWQRANEGCRGGNPDDKKTEKACGDRDVAAKALGKALGKANWCYGKEGQSHAEYDWHRCQDDSIR